MAMDLEQLFEPKKVKFEALKVYNKLTKEVVLIKSTRFNPAIHSINIPSGAHENLDFNHPSGTIDLSTKAPEAPNSDLNLKDDITIVQGVSPPVLESNNVSGSTVECSKCGKVCADNRGRAAHERACKFVTQ